MGFRGIAFIASVVSACIGPVSIASAADIKLLCAVAMRPATEALIRDFEKSSGHKVMIAYGTAGAITDRIQRGELADVAIVSGSQNDTLQSEGKIVSGSRVDIAKVGVGAFVRKGAPKPDLRSVESFKQALVAAKSIIYANPAGGGASGVYMASLLDRLGIGAEMKAKTKLATPGTLYDTVADGDVEIGFNQISENLAATARSGIELAGALPASIQGYTVFAAGVVVSSKQQEAGKALIAFLSSPSSATIMKAKGFE